MRRSTRIALSLAGIPGLLVLALWHQRAPGVLRDARELQEIERSVRDGVRGAERAAATQISSGPRSDARQPDAAAERSKKSSRRSASPKRRRDTDSARAGRTAPAARPSVRVQGAVLAATAAPDSPRAAGHDDRAQTLLPPLARLFDTPEGRRVLHVVSREPGAQVFVADAEGRELARLAPARRAYSSPRNFDQFLEMTPDVVELRVAHAFDDSDVSAWQSVRFAAPLSPPY